MFVLPPGLNVGDTVYLPFDTFDSDGASITITGIAISDIEVYKNGSVTQRASDNGYALLDTDGIDFDGAVGVHGFSIDTSDNSDVGFWVDGAQYFIVINAITVDTRTVRFTYLLHLGYLLRPTTAGRDLDVASTGEAGVDLGNVTGTLGNANVSWVDSNDKIALLAATQTSIDTIETDTTTDIPALIATAQADLNTITGADGVTLATTQALYAPATVAALASLVTTVGVAGVGLTDLGGMSTTMKGQVNTEADTALSDYDAPTRTEATADKDELITHLPSVLTKGTADSGTTSTMVDAARTEADTDYWKETWIRFTSGNISGQTRLIDAFVPGSDTIIFTPALTQAVTAGITYEILPAGSINVELWLSKPVTLSANNKPDMNVDEWADVKLATTNPLPNAAADAAGGLVISIAGGLDMDNIGADLDIITGSDGVTLASAEDVYHADIDLSKDDANTRDEYSITWFKNGVRVTSGITVPTIQVVKRVDGTDLVASTAMTQIGSTGSYKYDEAINRITAGEAVLVIVGATIDSGSRSFSRVISRDST